MSSSLGGYLLPAATPAPLEGQALLRFLQQVVVNITGLPGSMVRPRWQTAPADIPTAGVVWCAVGVMSRSSDTFPYVDDSQVGPTGNGGVVKRHETLEVLCSFYDLGYSGQADNYAELLRDGLMIAQNREVFFLNSFGLIETTELMAVPALVKDRWLYRVDFKMRLRRRVDRSYNVQSIEGVENIQVETDVPALTQIVTVLPPGVLATQDGLGAWVLEDGSGYWLWG